MDFLCALDMPDSQSENIGHYTSWTIGRSAQMQAPIFILYSKSIVFLRFCAGGAYLRLRLGRSHTWSTDRGTPQETLH
jgi:hypothetical protein